MLYAHGISPTTGLPFSPPLRFRQSDHVPNRPDEKLSIREGLCRASASVGLGSGIACCKG